MKQINLTIGLNDKDTMKQEISTEAARVIIEIACYEHNLDVTIVPVRGIYTMKNDVMTSSIKVTENSFRCEFYGANKADVVAVAKELCKDLNQETIAYAEIEIESEFISA